MSVVKEIDEVESDREDVIDWHKCEVLQFDPEKLSGSATLGASRLDADTILANYDDGMTLDELHDHFGGDKRLIQIVVDFIDHERSSALV